MSEASRINVLHLRSCRGKGGGPEKTILFSAKEADSTDFCLHVVYLKSKNDSEFNLHERARELGVENFTTIDENWKFDISALRKLLRFLKENQIHILHGHCYKSDLYGLILSRFHKMKLVTTAHGPLASFRHFWSSRNWRVRYLYDQIDLMILRHFDHVLMVSDSMRKVISRFGVRPEKLTWVKNSIDSQYFRHDENSRQTFRESLKIPKNAKVIGAVGRLNGEKDYPNFLLAAKQLLTERDDLYFTIAGTGELEIALKQQTKELGLAERVLFLGHFQDVRPVYSMMDAYVLSSTREGLPNTVLEAMSMEVPIVATDVDGVGEAVSHDREALLVPPRNPQELANAIQSVLNDPVLSRRLTSAARNKVEEHFSFANRMRYIESLYRRVLINDRTALSVQRVG